MKYGDSEWDYTDNGDELAINGGFPARHGGSPFFLDGFIHGKCQSKIRMMNRGTQF